MKTYDTKAARQLMERLAARNVALIKANKLVPEGTRHRGRFRFYVVKFSEMLSAMKQEGIAFPSNYINQVKWLQPIANKILPKYRKQLENNLPR